MAPKKVSGYFIFAEELRKSIHEDLQQNAPENVKVKISDVAKAIGERWGKLSAEEKDRYKALAQDRAQKTEASEQAGNAEDNDEKENEQGSEEKTGIPLGLVKRVMKMDDDLGRISSDAIAVTGAAAEMFLGLLGVRAFANAQKEKRVTVKFNDLAQATKHDKRLRLTGVPDVTRAVLAKLNSGKEVAAKQPTSKVNQVSVNHTIHQFFQPAPK